MSNTAIPAHPDVPDKSFKPEDSVLSKGWLWPFILALVFLTVNGLYGLSSLRDFVRSAESLLHAQQTKATIRDTYIAAQSAETNKQGFVITRDQEYLSRYYAAVQSLQTLLPILSHTTFEIPEQYEEFSKLNQLTQQHLEAMRKAIEYTQQSGSLPSDQIAVREQSLHYLRDIETVISKMVSLKDRLLNQRRVEVRKGREKALLQAAITLGVSLLLIGSVYMLVGRNARLNQSIAAKLRATNMDLEKRVEERTETIKRYSDELELSNRELARSNRELQDFAFVASHDLQEPLRKIRAFGDRLNKKFADSLGDQGADYVARMCSAAERMSLLISDLLTYSRVFSKDAPMKVVSLQALVNEVLDDLTVLLEEVEGEVLVGELPELECAAWQVRQLLQNLIGNALKFRQPDLRPVIRINAREISPGDQGDLFPWYEISIADNGIGFDQQHSDRIFTPFQRLHQRQDYPGTGIGLAVCRRVVERHGGSIRAEGKPGKGATFFIRLPSEQLKRAEEFEGADQCPNVTRSGNT